MKQIMLHEQHEEKMRTENTLMNTKYRFNCSAAQNSNGYGAEFKR
jgi:hypothetical protein